MQNKFKLWQPHLIAVGLFILVPIIYFWPALSGKALGQSDITNFLGVTREILDFRARFHTEPLWTNSMFGGMPAYQVSTYYAANLMQYIFQVVIRILPFPVGTVFFSCLCFYILMKVLSVDTWVAILGSFAFAFSSFFFIILAVGHNSEANAMAFMPAVLAGVILAFKGKRLVGIVLAAISLGLELYAGHLQITYYLFMVLGIYAIAQLVTSIKEKQVAGYFKTVAMLSIGALLAVGTNITSLWLTYDYGKYSTRGKSELTLNKENQSSGLTKDYATQWCYGVGETMTLMIPDYKGGASEPIGQVAGNPKDLDENQSQIYADFNQYFGDQPFTSGPVYVGAIICFFALMGMFLIKGSLKWFLIVSTILAVVLSWGKNPAMIIGTSVFDFFFAHVPGFNNFRAVSMILVIAELTLPIMAALAINRLVQDKDFMKESFPMKFLKNMTGKKIFFIALSLTAGIAALCYIMPTTFTSFQNQGEVNEWVQRLGQGNPKASEAQRLQYIEAITPAVEQARKKLFTGDAGRTFIFIILAAGLLWVYSKKLIDKKFFLWGLLFFVVVDMYNVNRRYLNDKNFTSKRSMQVPYDPSPADEQILKDTSLDYRVYNTTMRPDQDSRTSYFHKSIGGYSGVKMKRYDELMTYQIFKNNMAVLDMLNAKYFIVGSRDGKEEMAQQNPGALGNAWFVDNYRIVANADSEMTALEKFDPKHTVIVDQQFSKDLDKDIVSAQLGNDSLASIKIKSYEPNDLVYNSQSNKQRLAVFSEIYYKDGWDAFIDGKPTDYIRANYVLRAMTIPAGNHTIEFKFEPKHYAIGEKLSLASSLILLLSGLGLLFMEFRKKPAEAQE
ncbi:MAG TPA: YfhO family protein [Bacteroidia bacterium]|nr:YfhO family protein [Bacteroidia bacterium]